MAVHMVNGDKVNVFIDHERASWGNYAWVAISEDYDPTPIDYDTPAHNVVGEGNTEQEALNDYMEQL